jgi:hypothetical protein
MIIEERFQVVIMCRFRGRFKICCRKWYPPGPIPGQWIDQEMASWRRIGSDAVYVVTVAQSELPPDAELLRTAERWLMRRRTPGLLN